MLCYCYNVIKQLSLLRVTSTGQVVPADVSSLLIQCELWNSKEMLVNVLMFYTKGNIERNTEEQLLRNYWKSPE